MKTRKLMILFVSILFFTTIFLFCELAVFAASETPSEIISDTKEALIDMDIALDSGVFRSVLRKAKGVAIFPSLTEVAVFGLGGQGGKGIVLRKDRETGKWYGPAFLKVSAFGIGARAGIQSIDLLLVINSTSGLEAFMEKSFKFGGTLAWTLGPIGRSVSAEIDSESGSPIYSYSITKGLYFDAGSLQGSTIKEYSTGNKKFWGEELSNRTILETKVVSNPEVLKICNYIDNLGDD